MSIYTSLKLVHPWLVDSNTLQYIIGKKIPNGNNRTNFVDKFGTETTTVRYGGYHSAVRRLPQRGTATTTMRYGGYHSAVRRQEGISMTATTIIDHDKKSYR